MSFYQPTTVAAADYNIARRPTLGAEMDVYLSSSEVVEIGRYEMLAAGSGEWTSDAVNAAVLSADPSDLQVVVQAEVRSSAPVVVTVVGTDQNDAAITATATLSPPGWVTNQSYSFPEGYAKDLTPTVGGKMFKTITSVTFTNGARGGKFRIYKLPALTSFTLVGFTTGGDFTTKSRPPKPIADKLDGSAVVKFGRSEPGTLSLTAKYLSVGDGLQRFAGRRCTAMAIIEKEEQLITERLIFGNYVPNVRPSMPEGDGDATAGGEGMFEVFAAFVAP